MVPPPRSTSEVKKKTVKQPGVVVEVVKCGHTLEYAQMPHPYSSYDTNSTFLFDLFKCLKLLTGQQLLQQKKYIYTCQNTSAV